MPGVEGMTSGPGIDQTFTDVSCLDSGLDLELRRKRQAPEQGLCRERLRVTEKSVARASGTGVDCGGERKRIFARVTPIRGFRFPSAVQPQVGRLRGIASSSS
jgi:hypothetical protein